MTPFEDRTWIERQVANLYGIKGDSGYVDPSGVSGFYFNSAAPSLFDEVGESYEDNIKRGYFVVNTGNRTFDAIATVAMNEMGVDNAYKAFLNAREGNYASAFKEAAFAVGELATVAFPVGRAAVLGARAARGLPAAVRGAFSPAKARYNWQTGASTVTSPGGVGTRVGQTARNIPSQVASDFQRFGMAGPVVSGGRAVRGAARTLLPKGRRLRRILPIAGLASLAGLAMGRDPAAAQAVAAATSDPESRTAGLQDIEPVGESVAGAGVQARTDAEAINRQYNNILRELQGMYQLSETEEERERLRFLLADMEAQRDAGLQAISEGYAQTVAAIQQRAEISRTETGERSQRFGQELEGYADRTAQRMMLQNIEQQQQFRGLGSGSQTPINEWVGMMSAMAPLQQQYTQRMGDITSEGIDWMGDTVSAQGQAQAADLQRLAAATRSAGIMGHQRQVSDRIQRDTEALRAAQLQVMQQQAAAQSSGQNAVSPFDRSASIEEYALGRLGPGYIEQWLRDTGQSSLTPGELERIRILNQMALGQEAPEAAQTPVR